MIKIIIPIDSYKHFEVSIKEYEKRLGKQIEIIKIKPEKNGSRGEIMDRETSKIIEKLEKQKWYKVVLNPKGKEYTTEDFLDLVEASQKNFANIVFVIGWAYGPNYETLQPYIDMSLSLGKMTLPHPMAFMLLLEQCYRVGMMKAWKSYHK